jgi:Mn-dependent DtxR family transcriptional regulator
MIPCTEMSTLEPKISLPKLLGTKLSGRRAMILWLIMEGFDDNMTIASELGVSRSLVSVDLGYLAEGSWIKKPGGCTGRGVRKIQLTAKGKKIIQSLLA